MKGNLHELIDEMDRYVHQFIKLYKTKYEPKIRIGHLKKLTILEMGILNLLERDPGLSIREIIEILDVPNSTLTSVIDRLEKKEILKRIIHPEDKRTFKLELSEKGKEIVAQRMVTKKELFQTVLLALDTEEEREMLLKLMGKIYSNLSK